jgi:hypothetical protein
VPPTVLFSPFGDNASCVKSSPKKPPKGAQPLLRWKLPDLAGFDVERIRVGVRGGERVHGRFLSLLYASGLPPTATSFRIPAGVLAKGERYVFQVMLEDLEGEELENRSLTFSEVYTVPR